MVDRFYSDARLAALYDRLYPRSQSEDIDFYLPMVMAARAVLDVGCGTGVLLRKARQAGHTGRLCGLDPAGGMLAQARKRGDIEWICGDLASVDWACEFDLIVMTGHTFQVFVEDFQLRTALRAVRAALRQDGRFAFETRNPAACVWSNWDGALDVCDEQGNSVQVRLQIETPFDGQTVSFAQIFTSESWPRAQVSRSTLRFLDAGTLSQFLAEAGLIIEAQFGDWGRQPFTAASPEIITIARSSIP